MRHARIARLSVAPALAAVALVAGCILTSGQILISFDLDDPLNVTSPANIARTNVDLNTIEDYRDHKDKLNDLSDLALLGEITNTGTVALDIEFWMTTGLTTHLAASQVRGDATAVQLWGPLTLAPGETRRIDWDQSAALFRGRAALLGQVQGDGIFTLYVLGPAPLTMYSFRINDGVLVLVIDAEL
jgi:hypothetical protein